MIAEFLIAGAAVGTLALTVFGYVLRAIVRDIVRTEMDKQSEWLNDKFKAIDKWFTQHMDREHNGPSRVRR